MGCRYLYFSSRVVCIVDLGVKREWENIITSMEHSWVRVR
jgi:hypothetical protein